MKQKESPQSINNPQETFDVSVDHLSPFLSFWKRRINGFPSFFIIYLSLPFFTIYAGMAFDNRINGVYLARYLILLFSSFTILFGTIFLTYRTSRHYGKSIIQLISEFLDLVGTFLKIVFWIAVVIVALGVLISLFKLSPVVFMLGVIALILLFK